MYRGRDVRASCNHQPFILWWWDDGTPSGREEILFPNWKCSFRDRNAVFQAKLAVLETARVFTRRKMMFLEQKKCSFRDRRCCTQDMNSAFEIVKYIFPFLDL
jgi:hypothetical protein